LVLVSVVVVDVVVVTVVVLVAVTVVVVVVVVVVSVVVVVDIVVVVVVDVCVVVVVAVVAIVPTWQLPHVFEQRLATTASWHPMRNDKLRHVKNARRAGQESTAVSTAVLLHPGSRQARLSSAAVTVCVDVDVVVEV